MKNTLYIISGPLGIGKSTTSKMLANKEDTILLEGDHLYLALENKSVDWDTRIGITWKNIVSVIKEYLDNNLNVVLDFVVEDELEMIKQQFKDHDVNIKYVVSTASENTVRDRLEERKDIKYLEKSLRIMKKQREDVRNEKYLLDTSELSTEEIVKEILDGERFVI